MLALLYESRLAGWLDGYHLRDAEIAKLNWTADRLYTAMCSRMPKPYVDHPSFASLEAKRAEMYGGER